MVTEPSSPTAFSYVRFSSKKQEEGDSIRRQIELTSAWAKRNAIHLDTSLQPDRGISAFRGKNRDLGALGAFLRLVENGRVQPGSYLVVESLDRLTAPPAALSPSGRTAPEPAAGSSSPGCLTPLSPAPRSSG